MIAANNNWVASFDNMSKISDDLSDDLCVVATGGGIAKRAHYTNSEETILHVCRPIIMNAIEDIITRADLLDRSICITLPAIEEENRVPEVKLLEDFNDKLPKILGALLDAAVLAMKNQDSITLIDNDRMAGFVKWSAAGLGAEGDAFQEAYKVNRITAATESIEDNFLVIHIRRILRGSFTQSISGNATDILKNLRQLASEKEVSMLPKNANQLSRQLTRLAPSLKKAGILVEKGKRSKNDNTTQWSIRFA